jgi:tetrahydromethanopterin S-methyltransferase subunit A
MNARVKTRPTKKMTAIIELVGVLEPESVRKKEIRKYTKIVETLGLLDCDDLKVIERTVQSLSSKLAGSTNQDCPVGELISEESLIAELREHLSIKLPDESSPRPSAAAEGRNNPQKH